MPRGPGAVVDRMWSLAELLASGARTVFVTGAGLSVASGIAPYRGSKNAVWSSFVTEWGTRRKFLDDPEEWWNSFWLRTHESPTFLHATPNDGHWALARITRRLNAKIVTQNVDRLHLKTLGGATDATLTEVHGRLGCYRCTLDTCPFSHALPINDLHIGDYAVEGTRWEDGNLRVTPPLCSACGSPVMPLALFFDERYHSHSFFQWDRTLHWLRDADVIVFVGTSFSVGVTVEAFQFIVKMGKQVFNFNLWDEKLPGITVNIQHILGRAEKTLPLLNRMLSFMSARPRLWFYPLGLDEDTTTTEDKEIVVF